ncbi:MAG: hypothetical protein WA364_28305 [Candidatus Nitrosopolaris sp.]
MTENSYKFYCNVCFADRESHCICDRIAGYDAATGYLRVYMTDEEHAYLYNGALGQVDDELKLSIRIMTEDTGPRATTDNTTCNLTDDRSNENDIVDNKRFYCIDCSNFTGDEVSYDSNDRPVIRHNNDDKHHVIFGTDIQCLLELGSSLDGEITIYETAEMYDISVEKLEQILANIGKGV